MNTGLDQYMDIFKDAVEGQVLYSYNFAFVVICKVTENQ